MLLSGLEFAYIIRTLLAGNSSYSLIQLNNSFSHQCAFKMFLFLSLENMELKYIHETSDCKHSYVTYTTIMKQVFTNNSQL